MLKRYKLRFYNFRLVFLLLFISMIGIHLVGIAMPSLRSRQAAGVLMGLAAMVALSLMDYSWILNFQWIMYFVNIVMLLWVRFAGYESHGAVRWINLGFMQFQPTEISKIIIILFLARFFMDHEESINTLRTLVEVGILVGIPLFLIYSQPDMKNTITVGIIFLALLYVSGISYRIIIRGVLIAVPLLVIFLAIVMQPDQKLIQDYQRDRIMSFFYPEEDEYSDDAEQQRNSMTAIASGGLKGLTIEEDEMGTSVNEGNFVAENQTDFIFAVAGEKYGFLGCMVIVILLLLISIECVLTGRRAKDLAGKVICCGVGTLVAFQSFLNISVATGLGPNTGTPLPFVSYGLTSLISLFMGMGMVLNVGLQDSSYNRELKKKTIIDREEEYL